MICSRCRASGSMPAPARLPRALRANAQIHHTQLTRVGGAPVAAAAVAAHRAVQGANGGAFGDARAACVPRFSAIAASSGCAAPGICWRLFPTAACSSAALRWCATARAIRCARPRGRRRHAARYRVCRWPRRRDRRRRARHATAAREAKPRTQRRRGFGRAGQPVRLIIRGFRRRGRTTMLIYAEMVRA